MMKSIIQKSSLAVLFLFCLSSCRVTFVPNYDSRIVDQIEEVSMKIDLFYTGLLEKTSEKEGGREYDKFVDNYIQIEVELNSLLQKNKIRPLNENSIKICELTLEMWKKYKAEHRSNNSVSNGIIRLNKQYMEDMLFALRVSEKAKEMLASNNH